MKQRASTFAHLKNAKTFTSAQVGPLTPITNKSFGFAIVDDELIMVEGAFGIYHLPLSRILVANISTIYISAYNVRKEHWQGGKARVDIVSDVHRCFVVYRSAVLSTHSTTPISSYGMCGHTDHAFHSSPFPRIFVHRPKEFSSAVFLRSLHRTPIRPVLRYISHLNVRKTRGSCSSQGSPETLS